MKTSSDYALGYKWFSLVKRGCCPEWKDFEVFEAWAKECGWKISFVLRRYDKTLPFSPENCFWVERKGVHERTWEEEFAERWNKTVNRIRLHYGMEELVANE